MTWDQFKDFVPHRCLVGTVIASWSLIQEVAGLKPFTVKTYILVTEFSEFNENIWENTNVLSWSLPLDFPTYYIFSTVGKARKGFDILTNIWKHVI